LQNGWIDDFIGAEWFEKSFILQATAQNTSGKQILLVLDGHGLHVPSEIIHLAEANNNNIFCLSPHTTHTSCSLSMLVSLNHSNMPG
jgi:hypothetical protein